MNNPTTHKTGSGGCCSDTKCESGLRNNYFTGKRLTPDSFRVEQNYLLERRRLLNRSIHGWGVVYGFAVKQGAAAKANGPGRFGIGAGLALDRCGRELLQTESYVELGELLDEKGRRFDPDKAFDDTQSDRERVPHCWLLSVHYAEQRSGLVKVKDACECEWDEWDHICETVRFSLRRIPCSQCCDDFDCELNCECTSGPCCGGPNEPHDRDVPAQDDHQASQSPVYRQDSRPADHQAEHRSPGDAPQRDPKPAKETPRNRGGCRCICEHLTNLPTGCESAPLCEVDGPCGSVWVDLKNGVPLACVDLEKDDCDNWSFDRIEACGPRRLVKRNDLLFDLIRGCDLTRIMEVGWEGLLEIDEVEEGNEVDSKNRPFSRHKMSFETFANALGPDNERQPEYVSENFFVRFSRPVRKDTILPHCFAMTVISVDREGGWWETHRVPIVRLETTGFSNPQKPDPPGHVSGARVVVRGGWLQDALWGDHSIFYSGRTRVELEIRGDLIVDCNGQTVDANSHGFDIPPPGNGTPGGTFLSTFRVEKRSRDEAREYD